MKIIPLKSLLAIGALAFSCSAVQAQQVGAPLGGLVGNLLGNVGQNAGLGAFSSNGIGVGPGALAGSLGNLGQGALSNLGKGALSGNLNSSLNGSLNGVLSSGGSGARTNALALQGIGDIGGGSITVNTLNGNTRLSRSGNAGGAQ